MIKIHLSADAYWAFARHVPEQSRVEAIRAPRGGYFVWLDKATVAKLKAFREPSEGYSEAILRAARQAA